MQVHQLPFVCQNMLAYIAEWCYHTVICLSDFIFTFLDVFLRIQVQVEYDSLLGYESA
jgi:hypothetical protein